MRSVISVMLVLFGPVALAVGQQGDARPITTAENVLAIYNENHGLHSPSHARLILAIWGDGSAVWSDDRVQGGAPYRSGRIDPARLTSLLASIDRDGYFADESLAHVRFGPDSQFTTILVAAGKMRMKMQSWHELAEAGGKIVATKGGLTALNGRTRLEALSKEPSEYLHFRLAWSELRESASALIPSDSKPIDGRLFQSAGAVSWQPEP